MSSLTVTSESGATLELHGMVADSYAEEFHRLYGFKAEDADLRVVVADDATTITDGQGHISVTM